MMNKRQKIVLWISGVLISLFLIIEEIQEAWTGFAFRFDYIDYKIFIIPVIILTGLCFVTFKNK